MTRHLRADGAALTPAGGLPSRADGDSARPTRIQSVRRKRPWHFGDDESPPDRRQSPALVAFFSIAVWVVPTTIAGYRLYRELVGGS